MQTSSANLDTSENDPHSSQFCDQLRNADAASILSKEEITDSLGKILNNSQSFERVASKLNILEKIKDKGFYDLYQHMNGVLGHSSESYTFLGRLWAWGFNNSKETVQDWLCSQYVRNPDFFTPFHALQDILEHLKIEPHKLASWLVDIRNRLGEDLAQAPLSNGLSTIAKSKPAIARKVITIWDKQHLDENTIWMAASLLSHLRGLDQAEKIEIESIAEKGNEQQKLIYFRSMRIYDRIKPLSDKEYKRLISLIHSEIHDGLDETLYFIVNTIDSDARSNASFKFALEWIAQHIPSEPVDNWRHQVICLSQSTYERSAKQKLPPLLKSIGKTLPIPKKHKGTREQLDSLLEYLYTQNPPQFKKLLYDLAQKDHPSLKELGNYIPLYTNT